MHVTQSTLSHQIRQLEEELGQPLFDRIGKKVVTTEAGELFLGFAARALQEVDQGIAMLKPGSGGLTGQVRIGATHTFNIGLIPECVALFLARHPTVRVRRRGARRPTRSASGCAPASSTSASPTGRAGRPTCGSSRSTTRRWCWSCRAAHPLAGRKRIRMVELHQQRLVLLPDYFATRTLLDECFQASGAEPIVVAEMSTIAPMLGLVLRMQIGAIVAINAVPAAMTRPAR